MTDLERLIECAQESIADITHTLDPDGDYMPTMLSVSKGVVTISDVSTFFTDSLGKSAFAAFLPALFAVLKPEAVVLVTMGWSVMLEDKEALKTMGQPSEHKDRRENVSIQGYDGVTSVIHMAYVIRRPNKHPLLGPWQKMSQEIGGRIAGGLIEALNAVRKGA